MKTHYDILILGAGAAGFFSAINIAERNPNLSIAILEKSKNVLQKVKISGGGRCNVTHACFNPKELVEFYPRGKKELLGPFHQFDCGETFAWFDEKGIELKIEDDNRVFPVSNSSQTIIDCFLYEARKHKINILNNQLVNDFYFDDSLWKVNTKTHSFSSEKLIVSTGSNPKIWDLIEKLNHSIVKPVPSLFTFNLKDSKINSLAGITLTNTSIKIISSNFEEFGAFLFTDSGFSGPAILKLSAFAARFLSDENYQFKIEINFISKSYDDVYNELSSFKKAIAKKQVSTNHQLNIPKRLWQFLVDESSISKTQNFADLSNHQIDELAKNITSKKFNINGKSTFKEEFVTAGGIDLKEINFKRFESKVHKNLFFAGEVLNIDAVTGGFNFQNAWTGGFIIAKSITEDYQL